MSESDWRDLVRELAARAPAWMRERSSAALHIGGFTQVQLEVPVLELSDLDEREPAVRAIAFFLAVCLAEGLCVARVQCGRGPARAGLAEEARRAFADAVARLDDENTALMGYFDVYLRPAEELAPASRSEILQRLGAALGNDAPA